MGKLKSLLKATMSQDMNLFRIRKKETRKSKVVMPIVLAIIVMLAIGTYAEMFAEELAPMNLTYIVLMMFVLFTSVITFIEGIYKSQGILFDAKDNDLLFSLPISKARVLFTRIFKLITFQTLYNSLFMLPAMVVYALHESPDISFYLISLVMLLLLPIIPTILACIIGYVIKAVSSRFKARNAMQIVLTTVMLLLIFYASFNLEGLIENIAQNANSIGETISKIYYPAGLYINLIQNFNIPDLLILLGVSLIPAIIFIYMASIFYFKITSKLAEKGTSRKKGSKKNSSNMIKVGRPLSALINKEIKRFLGSPVFVINAGFGIVLILVITIALSINFEGLVNSFLEGEDIGMTIEEIKAFVPKIYYGIVVFCTCMTSITSSMISLEGKSFSITKSLPVSEEKILLAKVLTSDIISIPIVLISDIIFFVVFKPAVLDVVFILLASIVIPTFSALVGLLMNLKYPKMDATSDAEVVKQSMSSGLSVFIGIFVATFAIGVIVVGSFVNIDLFILLELIVFSVIVLILCSILKRYGAKRFREINV